MGHGQAILDATQPAEAIDRYYEMIASETNETGTGEARVLRAALKQGKVVNQGHAAELELDFEIDPSCALAGLHIYIMDEAMTPVVCLPVNGQDGDLRDFGPGRHEIVLPLGPLDLVSGKYSFTVAIADKQTKRALIRAQGLHEFRVFADKAHWGRVVRPIVAS